MSRFSTTSPASEHIRRNKKVYCGWREDKVYDPPLEVEYIDEESKEALCPLCGKMAYPMSSLKNLHDHESSYVGELNG